MLDEDELNRIVRESRCKTDVFQKLGWNINSGYCYKRFDKLVNKYQLDISHFVSGSECNRKNPIIIKTCPVCKNNFETSKNSKGYEKTTCSNACAKTYFRTGENHPNWKPDEEKYNKYRYICFNYYEYKCALCDWNICVDVHHINGNNKDDRIENLIPLCQNHHRMVHIDKYKEDINRRIENIKNNIVGKIPSGLGTHLQNVFLVGFDSPSCLYEQIYIY